MPADPSVVTTEITIAGANCPWCLEATVDALRAEPGVVSVDASTIDGCLSVAHRDLDEDRLLGIVRRQLHGYDRTPRETVMVEVDPQIAALHCPHTRDVSASSATDASAGRQPTPMETALEAAARLRSQGYAIDFSATNEGRLRCGACGVTHDPSTVVIEHVFRYEGASDPDDQTILLALRCGCGGGGLYLAAYGPEATAADVTVLRQLS